MISDGYFEAAGIRLEAGRGFTEQDRASSERVVIVNQTLASNLWPGQDPIRTERDTRWRQAGGRRGGWRPPRSAEKRAGPRCIFRCSRPETIPTWNWWRERRCRGRHSLREFEGRSGRWIQICRSAKIRRLQGFGGQSGVPATISGHAAGRIRGLGAAARFPWHLCVISDSQPVQEIGIRMALGRRQ
jgi:hypothetical protein